MKSATRFAPMVCLFVLLVVAVVVAAAAQFERLPVTDPGKSEGQEGNPPLNTFEDPSFEGGAGGGFWSEFSTLFGTPLCDAGSCGTGGGTAGPLTGDWWAWFGGSGAGGEEGWVEQTVTIESGTAVVGFNLWADICRHDRGPAACGRAFPICRGRHSARRTPARRRKPTIGKSSDSMRECAAAVR